MASRYQTILVAIVAALLAVSVSCGKKRPIDHVVENDLRISKENLQGEFFFLKTITKVDTPGFGIGEVLFPGIFLEQGNVVKFEFKENRLDVVAVEAPLDQTYPRETSPILASFPIMHVDILWQKNADDKDTRIEEETQSRNPWDQRGYAIIDITSDSLDQISQEFARTITSIGGIDYDPKSKAINFELEKNLNDGTVIHQKYSFLAAKTDDTYQPETYSINEKQTFGFFDTVTYSFNDYGRVTDDDLKRYINRWKPDENIVYYLSEDYPEHLIDETKAVFESWNDVFENATGRRLVELKGNAGETMGDMRYSMIYYVNDRSSKNIIGYGPMYANPKTGQILKSDVFLYGATLKNAIYSERQWIEELDDSASLPTPYFPLMAQVQKSQSRFPATLGLEDLSSFKRAYYGDDSLLANLGEKFGNIAESMEKLRTSDIKDYRKITMITPEAMSSIHDLALADDVSDEELEIKIFGPLLAHELGHNFGLRHNFMGSADAEFISDVSQSSSVMDYTFLTSKSEGRPGPYDAAAIAFAYGDDEKRSAALEKSYFYCTDEDLFSSRMPLCAQFDSGTTLMESAENQFNKYTTSYQFNNLRGDRAFFEQNIDAYVGSIFRFLIPFRLIIDNANALEEMVTTSYEPGTDSETRVFRSLWELLGKKIEADETSDEANTVEISLSDEVTKKFDIAKIQGLATDAADAKSYAVAALTATIQETARENYDSLDTFNRQLAVRGVLLDKLIAMIILAEDTPDPLGRGTIASALTNKESEIGSVFVDIISNTRSSSSSREFSIWDVNLRRMALNLLQLLALPGKETSEMIELLTLLEFVPADLTGQEKTDYDATYLASGHDDVVKDLVVQSLAANVTQGQLNTIATQIQTELTARNQRNFAAIKVKDRYFKTPISLDIGGLDLTSATGLLIRDSLNQFDIRVTAYQEAIATLDAQILAESDVTTRVQLSQLREDYGQTLNVFRRFVNQEKRLIEEIYSIYHPNR